MKNIKKNILLLFAVLIAIQSCMIVGDYPMTSFWVINKSSKTIYFNASIMKFSRIMGTYEMSLPFTVAPNDSVMVRKVGFKVGANPRDAFINFEVTLDKDIRFNDPGLISSWVKSLDKDSYPKYSFFVYDDE